jgi:hypothetical protein
MVLTRLSVSGYRCNPGIGSQIPIPGYLLFFGVTLSNFWGNVGYIQIPVLCRYHLGLKGALAGVCLGVLFRCRFRLPPSVVKGGTGSWCRLALRSSGCFFGGTFCGGILVLHLVDPFRRVELQHC